MTTLQDALDAPGCERIKDFYRVGPVQRAAVESLVDALAQQDDKVTALRSQVEYLEKIVEDQAKVIEQQGEQPTQRQLDTTMRQWETWKAYALELQAKLVKYEGGAPMLLNAAAPAPQPAQTKQVLEKLEQLSDDEIFAIAHRTATRYTHFVQPGQVMYGFAQHHMIDLVRAIEAARGIGEVK